MCLVNIFSKFFFPNAIRVIVYLFCNLDILIRVFYMLKSAIRHIEMKLVERKLTFFLLRNISQVLFMAPQTYSVPVTSDCS